MDVSSRGQKVLAKFHGTRVPDDQLNLINVRDFATPVSQVEVFRQGNDTLMFELSVNGQFDYRYDRADKMFIIEVKKRSCHHGRRQAVSKHAHLAQLPGYSGETVLQIIADFNNLNLVTTDSVSGNITLRLDGVPWEQALDIILKVRGWTNGWTTTSCWWHRRRDCRSRETADGESQPGGGSRPLHRVSADQLCQGIGSGGLLSPRYQAASPRGRSVWMSVPTCWWSGHCRMSSATSNGCWISSISRSSRW